MAQAARIPRRFASGADQQGFGETRHEASEQSDRFGCRHRRRCRGKLLVRQSRRDGGDAASAGQSAPPEGGRKILYYRNPMGLPDTSPVPKKDPMGMDYIAGLCRRGGGRQHRQGQPRQGPAQRRAHREGRLPADPRTVRGIGTIEHDETLLWIVTVRSDGYIEDLFVNKTGQHVTQRRAAVPLLQPADSTRAGRSSGRSARGRPVGRIRHEPEPRRRHATIAQSRRSRKPHRGGARRPDQPAHHRLGFARDRRHHREESHPGPAGHGRRRAVPHRRSLQRLGGRRSGRGRYRRDQGGQCPRP